MTCLYSVPFISTILDAANEVTGRLQVNELENLTQIVGLESRNDAGVETNVERFELRLGTASRLFELQKLDEKCKVKNSIPKEHLIIIWFLGAIGLFEFSVFSHNLGYNRSTRILLPVRRF